MYNEQRLVSITQFSSPVNAMTFGKFGREDSTLISVTCKGKGFFLDTSNSNATTCS